MELQILGSGSCVVQQERASSGYLLKSGDKTIMVDTGTGTTDSLRKAGHSTSDIDIIIHTHRHPDHVSDLVPIIQDKVVRSFEEDESDLIVFGPEGHGEYLERRMHDEMRESPSSLDKKFGFELLVEEISKAEISGIEFEVQEAHHGPSNFPCYSLKVKDGEDIVAFTGDTDYHQALPDFVKGANLVIADCSKPDGEKSEGHMTPSECAAVAKKGKVDKLVLSHLYPEAEETNVIESAGKGFEGEIVLAEDLRDVDVQ